MVIPAMNGSSTSLTRKLMLRLTGQSSHLPGSNVMPASTSATAASSASVDSDDPAMMTCRRLSQQRCVVEAVLASSLSLPHS